MKARPAGFFFTQKELEETAPLKIDTSLLGPDCPKCKMYKDCKHPRLDYTGEGRKNCLIVAEANGPDEDQYGVQLIGEVGQFFRSKLAKHGLDLDKDFWKMNAVNCFPQKQGSIRPPTRAEIKYCRPMVEKAIQKLKPQFIWLMGGKAVESFYMEHFTGLTITRWRGLCIPDRKHNAYIIPLFHPSFLRRSNDPNLDAVYDADLKNAISHLQKGPFQHSDESPQVTCLYDIQEICKMLDSVIDDQPFSVFIDYETNHLKAQTKGAKIASIALTYRDKSFAFPYQYRDFFTPEEQREIKRRWRKILSSDKIWKIAQNLKFEYSWSKNIFGVEVKKWLWDTMIASHVLDCRSKFSGLKFQAYINFGVLPYDKLLEKYLKSGPGRFNKVDDAPLGDLLLYNGLDTLYGHMLYKEQWEQYKKKGKNLYRAYKFFHEGIQTLADVQESGININEDFYLQTYDSMEKELTELKKSLETSKEAEEYRKIKSKVLDIDSGKELGVMFYDVLKLPPIFTDKESYQVDKKALHAINTPFVESLLTYRRKDKIRNTYLAQFIREVANGRMYPFFDLHIPITYRSSSSAPNFQNIPVRDEEAKRICRTGIIPSPGNKLMEADYSGIEVKMAACYTKDKSLIKYVTDAKTDMHRDSAADIWMISQNLVSKPIRFYAKNGWVFPQFYGSYYVNCGKELWGNCLDLTLADGSATLEKHLQNIGISSFDDFINHLSQVEHKFWYERFAEYKAWKDNIQLIFQKQGYIESFLGFRYTGYLSYNEVSNYAIQGTAFHCLLWSLIELVKLSKIEKWKSKVIGQIHDSIVVDLYPPEQEHVIDKLIEIGTKKIRETFDWIIVPLDIGIELTGIDEPWCEKKEI